MTDIILNDAISTTVEVANADGEAFSFTAYRGSVDGKDKPQYQAEYDGRVTAKAFASVIPALKAAAKAYIGEAEAKTLLYKDASIDWPEAGDNSAAADDWTAAADAETVQAETLAAVESLTVLRDTEGKTLTAARDLGAHLFAIRSRLTNKQFSSWKAAHADAEKTSPEMAALLSKKGGNELPELVQIGACDERVLDAMPPSKRSPKTILAFIHKIRRMAAEKVAANAFALTGEEPLTSEVLSDATYDFVFGTERLNCTADEERVLNVLIRGVHAENMESDENPTLFSTPSPDAGVEMYYSPRFEGEPSRPVVGNCFSTYRVDTADEFVEAVAKAATAELKAREAAAAAEAEKAAAEAEKAEATHAVTVSRNFADFSVEEAALHIFKMLAARFTGEGEETSIADAADVNLAVADLLEQVEKGVAVSDLLAAVPLYDGSEENEADVDEAADEADAE